MLFGSSTLVLYFVVLLLLCSVIVALFSLPDCFDCCCPPPLSVVACGYLPFLLFQRNTKKPELGSLCKFKIGLCQLSVTADKARNIDHARKAIEDAAQKGAKLVVLPSCPSLSKALSLEDAISDLPSVTNYEEQDERPYEGAPVSKFQQYIRLKREDMMPFNGSAEVALDCALYDHRPLQLNKDDYQRVCQIPKKKAQKHIFLQN
ncbi:uncharacterized protein LOC104899095 isoform X1 [Beta vulgaris subsp. vulgaris]|uniref:uncharacterized protein LOC104899095 isoform X1 n=1 Tax=Beta vulgaris subsp. vulgaris TaxID=3555 RepID=UPI002036FBAB|nr:uncharacterized protein LOC104899095 isoform X1 [Beta vulgaris subsp. vulgaris]